ncbi:MAG: undecaprenyl-diphosphate phosphatase, partial [Bacillota bacterium]|nr:undecaprenyl-diphosphate phosphatase [Bacillota bacterium]
MIEWLKAFVYGLVEGISEWLPISSTGHLIILEQYFPLQISAGFRSFFLVAIQLGAVMAALLYFSKFLLSRSLRGNLTLLGKIVVSCVPAAAVGILFDDWIDAHFYHYTVVSLMLILFGIVFLYVDESKGSEKSLDEIGYKDAFVIGIFQLISAVFPGVSRSGATIIGGLRCGLSRKVAAEYTFIMSIPVMLGAGLLKLIKLKEVP